MEKKQIPTIDGKEKVLIDSISLQKEGFDICIHIYKSSISIVAIKDLLYYTGSIDEIEQEDIEPAVLDIKKGEVSIVATDKSNLRVRIKGLQAIKLTLDTKIPQHEKEILMLKKEVSELKETIATMKASNPIVNVTVHVDKVRRPYSTGDKHVILFNVDKKLPNTILLIQANICVHGESCAETIQEWRYGEKTIVYGQTENYSNNSEYGRPIPSMVVISGHEKTGPQELKLSWNSSMLPFKIINPNKSDHSQYFEGQTCSVYTVWELIQ